MNVAPTSGRFGRVAKFGVLGYAEYPASSTSGRNSADLGEDDGVVVSSPDSRSNP